MFKPIYQGQTLVNVSRTELEIENWELENGKNWERGGAGGMAFQKVAKTGYIGEKKSSGRRYRLCKIPQHAEG